MRWIKYLKLRYVAQTCAVAIWFTLLMLPAAAGIFYVSYVYRSFDNTLSLRNAYLILEQMFLSPGDYYAWLLFIFGFPTSDHSLFSFIISVLLFLPFVLWLFLKSEHHKFLKRLLQCTTILFVLLYGLALAFIEHI